MRSSYAEKIIIRVMKLSVNSKTDGLENKLGFLANSQFTPQ